MGYCDGGRLEPVTNETDLEEIMVDECAKTRSDILHGKLVEIS